MASDSSMRWKAGGSLVTDSNAVNSYWCVAEAFVHLRTRFPVTSPHSVVRPRLTVYVCQESQREQQVKHENGDAGANTFFGSFMPVTSRLFANAVFLRQTFQTVY